MAHSGQQRSEKFTRQQWATIGIIGSVHFASAICISLQAPFYPQEVSYISFLEITCHFYVKMRKNIFSLMDLALELILSSSKYYSNTRIFENWPSKRKNKQGVGEFSSN